MPGSPLSRLIGAMISLDRGKFSASRRRNRIARAEIEKRSPQPLPRPQGLTESQRFVSPEDLNPYVSEDRLHQKPIHAGHRVRARWFCSVMATDRVIR